MSTMASPLISGIASRLSPKKGRDSASSTPHRPGILASSTPKSNIRALVVSETPKSDFMSFVENVLSPIVIGVSPMNSMMTSPQVSGAQIPISSRYISLRY